MPPIASISLTIWPFPIPPIAGLHDIAPILFLSIVINSTWAPALAAAHAASTPACPPPITIISVSFVIFITNKYIDAIKIVYKNL